MHERIDSKSKFVFYLLTWIVFFVTVVTKWTQFLKSLTPTFTDNNGILNLDNLMELNNNKIMGFYYLLVLLLSDKKRFPPGGERLENL